MEFVAPHKYLKNTPKNGTILTEHLLNMSGRLQTPKRTRKIPSTTGQDERKKKKRKEESKKGPAALAES